MLKNAFTATLITLIIFIAGDAIVIPNVMRPLFKAYLGDGMLDTLRLFPAALFYLIHCAGLGYFAVAPNIARQNPARAFLDGAILGLVAYSCYEMTSWVIMRDWHLNLVLIDTAWGTFISGFAALCGTKFALWRAAAR
jgi:uncharacterized membrane protein